ncbi:hypothetical protein Ciccas_000732 [Cichlidogyrus casuarinus]|uniref:Non-specific serine/threonine protein kinase n=1 Tax=Cichlidogyrus casuarinus TaxID=1844966 RepID=A0ABD2QM03_9PLAT
MNAVYNLLDRPETLVLLARSTDSLTLQNFLDQVIEYMCHEISSYKPTAREKSLDLSPPISKHMSLINLGFQLSKLFNVNINVCDDRIIEILGSTDSQKSLIRDLSLLLSKSLNFANFNSIRIMELCQCLYKLLESSQLSEIRMNSILKGYFLRTGTAIEEIAALILRLLHDPTQISSALHAWIWGCINFPHSFNFAQIVTYMKKNILQHAFNRPARCILNNHPETSDCTFVKGLAFSRSQLADLNNLSRVTFYRMFSPDLDLDHEASFSQTLLNYANLLLVDMVTSSEEPSKGASEMVRNLFSSCWKAIIRDSSRSDFSSKLNLHSLLNQLSKIFQLAALTSVFLIKNKISFPEIGSLKLETYDDFMELFLTFVRCLDASYSPFSWVIIAHTFQILTLMKLSNCVSEDLAPFLQFFSDVFNEQNSLLELELMLNAFISLLNCLDVSNQGRLDFKNLVQQILVKLTKAFDYSSAKRAANVKFLEQKISQSNVEYLLIQSLIRISRSSVIEADSYERMLVYLRGKLECNLFSSYHSDLLVSLVVMAKNYPKIDKTTLHKANLIQSRAFDLVLCFLFPAQVEEETDTDASIVTQKNLLKCLLTLLDKHCLLSENCPLYCGYVSPSTIKFVQELLVDSLGCLASATFVDGEVLALATECFMTIGAGHSSEVAIQYSKEALRIIQSAMNNLSQIEKIPHLDHQATKRIRLDTTALNQVDLERTLSLLDSLHGESLILNDLTKEFKTFLKHIRAPFEDSSEQQMSYMPDFDENADSKLATDSFSAGNGIIKLFDQDIRWRSQLANVSRFLTAFLKCAFRQKHMKTISRFLQHLATVELTSYHTILIFEQLVYSLCHVILEDSDAQSVAPLLLIQTLCPASELLNTRLVEHFRKGQFDSVQRMLKLFGKMSQLFLISVSQPGVLNDQSREPIAELASFFESVIKKTFVSFKQFLFAVGDPIITDFHATFFAILYQAELAILQAQCTICGSSSIASCGIDDLLLSMLLNSRTAVPAQEIIIDALFFRDQFAQYWNVSFLKTQIQSLMDLLRSKAHQISCSNSNFLGYLLDSVLKLPSQLFDNIFLKSFALVIFNWAQSWPSAFDPDLEALFRKKLSRHFSSQNIFATFKQIFFYPHLKTFTTQFHEIEPLKRFLMEPELGPWLTEISLLDSNNNITNESVHTLIEGIILTISNTRKTICLNLTNCKLEDLRRSITLPGIFRFYLQNCPLKTVNYANPVIQLLDFAIGESSSIKSSEEIADSKQSILKAWFKKQSLKEPDIVHELLQLSNEIFIFPVFKILANFEKEPHFYLAVKIWLKYTDFLVNTLAGACTTPLSNFLRDFMLKNFFDLLWTAFDSGFHQTLCLFLQQFPKVFPATSLDRSPILDALFNLALEMTTRHFFVQKLSYYDQLRTFFQILLNKTQHFYLVDEMAIWRRFPLCTDKTMKAFLRAIEDGAAEAPFSIQLQRLDESLSHHPNMKLNRAWAFYNLSGFWTAKTAENVIDFTVPATDFVDKTNQFTLSRADEKRLSSVILTIINGSDFESRKAAIFCQELFLTKAPNLPIKEIKMLPSNEFLLDKVKDLCILANKPSQAEASVTAMKIIRDISQKGCFFKSSTESKFSKFEHRSTILQQFSLFNSSENIFSSAHSGRVKLAKNALIALDSMDKLLRLCKTESKLATKICQWLINNKMTTETAFCYFLKIFEQSEEYSRSFAPWMLVDFLKGFEHYSTGKVPVLSRLQESFSEVEYWFLNADVEQSHIWIEAMQSIHLEAEFYRLNNEQLFSEFTFPIDLNRILQKSIAIPHFSSELCAQLFERAWLMYQPSSEEYLQHFASLEMWLDILLKQRNISGIKTVQLLIARLGGSWTEEYETLKNKSEQSLEMLQSHQSVALEKLSSWDSFCSVAVEMAQNSSLTNLSAHFDVFEKTLVEDDEVLSKVICIEKLLSPMNEFSLIYKVLDSLDSVAFSETFFAMGRAINLEVKKDTLEIETVDALAYLRFQELGAVDKHEVFKTDVMTQNLQARYLQAKRMFDVGNVKLACGILSTALEQANLVSVDLRLLRTMESLSIVYADWLWTSRSEDLSTIINDVLDPMLKKLVDFQLQSLELVKSISTSYDCMARFCDRHYTVRFAFLFLSPLPRI